METHSAVHFFVIPAAAKRRAGIHRPARAEQWVPESGCAASGMTSETVAIKTARGTP